MFPHIGSLAFSQLQLCLFPSSSSKVFLRSHLAPFIEKFSSVSYGKRKTWVIISQILASLLIFTGSFFTHESTQLALALIFLFTLICITLQDISLDAMTIKELKSPYIAAMTQAIMQTIGMVVGGLAFLKASSL